MPLPAEPYSYTETEASGETALVSVPFPYLHEEHVHVRLDGDLVPQGELEWTSPNTILLPETPPSGTIVRVFRVTPADRLLVEFVPNALDHRDLNNISLQLLYIIQEAFDHILTLLDLFDDIQALLAMVQDLIDQLNALFALAEEMFELANNAYFKWSMPVSVPFTPNPLEAFFAVRFTKELILPEDFEDSQVWLIGAPTGDPVVITIERVDGEDVVTTVGTITYGTDGSATLSECDQTTFEVGDVLRWKAPNPVDSNFKHFGATLEFVRPELMV